MTKPPLILFLIGVALSIAQFVMIRDFVSILYGEEVVIVLVTASFFLGLSVGYTLALRVPLGVFRVFFVISVFLHLTFPFSYRYLAAWFGSANLGGYAFLGLLFVYALIFNTVFAIFLPRLVSSDSGPQTTEATRLRTYYSVELAGFVTGFGIVALSWNNPIGYLLAAYWSVLGLLLFLVLKRRLLTVSYVALALTALAFINQLDRHSTDLLYRYKHHIVGAQTLFSVNSAYQKVEVVESKTGTRYLYLDGLQNLNSTDLTALNYYIAEVPAMLIMPAKTLLIGNGTLSSVPKVYPYSGQVTSVELDGAVLLAGQRFFTTPDQLQGLDNWQLYVDDGKHFLRSSTERYDLVVVDVPSPLTIQEAYLHTVEFYSLVKESLTEQGVIAVQLSGPLQRNARTPARVVAALAEVFPQVIAIYSPRAERGFAYASRSLPFSGADVRTQSSAYEKSIKVIEPAQVESYLTKAVPLSVDNMDIVLRRGLERFLDRYFR